ncbi:MAG TPA: transcription elongation factor GreA [Candidatus Woesebacteria bacterium]|nr:transcription elongation factor GreA [Candidatus Woesebacteria bacterium]
MSDTITITQTGFEELQQELFELKTTKMPKVIERISNAREQGDLSENADYHSARDERDILQARINEIEEILLKSKVASVQTSDVVSLGSIVVLEVVGKNKKITYQMSGEYESNPAEGKISIESPVGKALLNKSKGDKVEVQTPAGQVTYKILEIK